jgi:hypothetical protein
MDDITNGFLKPHANSIDIFAENKDDVFNKVLASHGVPVNDHPDGRTIIDWDQVPNSHHFTCYEGCEEIVTLNLLKTPLADSDYILIETGYDDPVWRVETKTFIDHWHDFFSASGYMGAALMNSDATCIAEITEDDLFYSNFKIM